MARYLAIRQLKQKIGLKGGMHCEQCGLPCHRSDRDREKYHVSSKRERADRQKSPGVLRFRGTAGDLQMAVRQDSSVCGQPLCAKCDTGRSDGSDSGSDNTRQYHPNGKAAGTPCCFLFFLSVHEEIGIDDTDFFFVFGFPHYQNHIGFFLAVTKNSVL